MITDDGLRDIWFNAGGSFHGPKEETGTMPEAKLLPFLRKLHEPTDLSACAPPHPCPEPEKAAEEISGISSLNAGLLTCVEVATGRIISITDRAGLWPIYVRLAGVEFDIPFDDTNGKRGRDDEIREPRMKILRDLMVKGIPIRIQYLDVASHHPLVLSFYPVCTDPNMLSDKLGEPYGSKGRHDV